MVYLLRKQAQGGSSVLVFPNNAGRIMNPVLQSMSMDRTTLTVASLADPPDDKAYWQSKTPAERMAALEFLRVVSYGYDPTTARLQRVLEVVELGAS